MRSETVVHLVEDFALEANGLGSLKGWPTSIEYERLPAPHRQTGLRTDHGAVYVFATGSELAARADCGWRALKVGRVGPRSDARFRSQHYRPGSARSTLAGSLLITPVLWSWLGVESLDSSTIKTWMLTNLERHHLYVPQDSAELIPMLERFVRGRLGPVFEG